jgi:outer membrane protein
LHYGSRRPDCILPILAYAGIYLATICGNAAAAETETAEKKWELGVGLASLTLADYRGSKEYSTYALPIPYIVYRGKYIKADRRGVRGEIIQSDRVNLDISLNASLINNTEENDLRHGMPELDPTFEVGPALNLRLSGHSLDDGWSAYMPARAVIAFNTDKSSMTYIGWLLHPQLIYRNPLPEQWQVNYSFGLFYGDRDYHDYYYSVAPRYATADRPAYRATAGNSGLSTQVSLTHRAGNIWYGGYIRYDNLQTAAFADSPLLETDHYFAVGLGISRIFK